MPVSAKVATSSRGVGDRLSRLNSGLVLLTTGALWKSCACISTLPHCHGAPGNFVEDHGRNQGPATRREALPDPTCLLQVPGLPGREVCACKNMREKKHRLVGNDGVKRCNHPVGWVENRGVFS